MNEVRECLNDNPSTAGKAVGVLEKALSDYFDRPVVATNSGTSALHLSLMALGIGNGDEVILPVTTFVATANAVRYVGAKPVFVDVRKDTWCMDWEEVARAFNGKTKACIPVHLYGNVCETKSDIQAAMVEDAAESLGSLFNGIKTGTLGDLGCFSFNGNKTITGGCGGLVVCQSEKQATLVRTLCSPLLAAEGGYVGYNYRIAALNASLAHAQFNRFDDFLAKKKRFRYIYEQELGGYVRFQQPTLGANPSWWYTAGTFDRPVDDVISKLNGIPFRRVFKPLTAFETFRDSKSYPVAEFLYSHGLCFPCSTRNTDKEIQYVCRAIRKVL